MACSQYITLPTGAKMPALGIGTWQAKDGPLESALEEALRIGYRHIDTAAVYENEHVIGKILQDWLSKGKLKREDLFVVTKLPPSGNRPEGVEKFLKQSLEALKLDYVDLYLIHVPVGFQVVEGNLHPIGPDGKFLFDFTTDHVAIWKEMEKQVDAGLTKAIGLSNFNEKQIQRILDNSRIPPANLQVELHVYFQQRSLVQFCKSKNITVTAYSPLGSRGTEKIFAKFGHIVQMPDLIANPTVASIAEKYKKTPAQILLKHILQRGICTIPRSTNPERLLQNIKLFDFELDSADVEKLDALDQGKEGRLIDFKFMKGIEEHPEYPFH